MTRTLAMLLVIASSATTALAQSDSKRADELFREGRKMLAAGKIDEACLAFEGSNKAEASVGALLNLGECELKRQAPARAWIAFRRAKLLARATGDAQRARFAQRQMDKVGTSLGFVVVSVPAEWRHAPGLAVSVDGRQLGDAEIGPLLPVEPGVHEVSATATGAVPFRTQVDVRADGAEVSVEIALVRDRSAAGESTARPTSSGGDAGPRDVRKLVGMSMTAAGAAAVVVSVALGASARSKWNGVKDCRERVPPCSLDEIERGDSARATANVATGFFVVGAIVAGAGVALWATSGDRSGDRGSETERQPAAVSVAPVVDGESFGVMASGRF